MLTWMAVALGASTLVFAASAQDVMPCVGVFGLGLAVVTGLFALLFAGFAVHEARPRLAHVVGFSVVALLGGGFAFAMRALGELSFGHGRPWRRGGRPVRAGLSSGCAWTRGDRAQLDRLDASDRTTLGAAWAEAGRAEHASVAAFAELSQRLLAAGAPPSLLVECHRAAVEEVDHAEKCFSLASAYAGRAIGPGPVALPAGSAFARNVSLADLAAESLSDGCYGEGLAAAAARCGAERASDPVVRDVLETIHDDERSHAELSWAIVEWCVAEGGAPVAKRLRRTVLPRRVSADGATLPPALARHGLPTLEDLELLAPATRAEVEARRDALLSRGSRPSRS